MYPSEFIKSELNKFIVEFPKTRIRYENQIDSNTHTVEVVPNEIYHLDQNYIDWENIFFDKFVADFPDQNICFISDDAIVGLDKIDFELFGELYSPIFSTNKSCYPSNIAPLNINTNFTQANFIDLSTYIGFKKVSSHIASTFSSNKKMNFESPNNLIDNLLFEKIDKEHELNFPLAA